MIDATKLTLEWLAGFFDGEGCVCLRRQTLRGEFKGWSLRVNVTQANLELISAIVHKFSASYGPYRKPRSTRSGKESIVYECGWYGPNAKEFLLMLLPLVVVKRQQVEIGLEYLSTLINNRTNGSKHVPEEIATKRDSLVNRMRALNHAGPYKPASETDNSQLIDTKGLIQ